MAKKKNVSYYHSLEYFEALSKTKGVKPCFIAVTDFENNILAATIGELANEISWLPLTKRLLIYDKPLYTDDEDLFVLLNAVSKIKAGLFVQIRTFRAFTDIENRVLMRIGFKRKDHLNAYIPIKDKDENEIFTAFKKDKRVGIKKAIEKYDLRIVESDNSEQDFDIFYNIQSQLYKRKHHAIKSKAYFENLIRTSNGNVRMVFIYYKGQPIATRLYSIYNKRCSALYVATLKEFKSLYANDLLVWYAIQKGIEQECDYFDFGGGGNPNKKYGPREYKARFNTMFENVGRYNLPKSPFYKIVILLYDIVLKK